MRFARLMVLPRVARVLLLVGLLDAADACAGAGSCPTSNGAALPRACDQLWLVRTRAFSCGDPRLHVGAYGAESPIGTFSDALMAEAKQKNWAVISMKKDWKKIFAFEK